MSSSLKSIKAASLAKQAVRQVQKMGGEYFGFVWGQLYYITRNHWGEKAAEERRRGALVLILSHLLDAGYLNSVSTLEKESGLHLDSYVPADNIDLMKVIQEYEFNHSTKYPGSKLKLYRRDSSGVEQQQQQHQSIKPRRKSVSATASMSSTRRNKIVSGTTAGMVPNAAAMIRDAYAAAASGDGGSLTGTRSYSSSSVPSMSSNASTSVKSPSPPLPPIDQNGGREQSKEKTGEDEDPSDVLLKPLAGLDLPGELRDLALVIQRDIFTERPGVSWEDVIGLSHAKQVLREAVVLPLKFPSLFTGILSPWKGALLFGPPGTGKTMLAKAVATECKTTFFNISASSIVSKWRGDSEKLVRVLFELARYHAPSTIFFDEIDAIMTTRGGSGGSAQAGTGEHEGSRRLKTELLVQMDGLRGNGRDKPVFVLAASNTPWDLDPAFVRRLEKRIYVGLPEAEARAKMASSWIPPERTDPEVSWATVAAATEGYSGSDLHLVVKEAAMRPLRRLMTRLDEVTVECGGNAPEYTEAELQDALGAVTLADFKSALSISKPASSSATSRYQEWNKNHGS